MKKNKLFIIILTILFLLFCGLYFTYGNGYYEYTQYKKQVLTKQQINQFEKDIKKGKRVDVNKYVNVNQPKNNKIASVGNALTNVIGKIMKNTTLAVFESMSEYVAKS